MPKVVQCPKERFTVTGHTTPVSTKLLTYEVCIVMFFHTEMNDYVVVSTSLQLRFLVRFVKLTTVCISVEYITKLLDIFCNTIKKTLINEDLGLRVG